MNQERKDELNKEHQDNNKEKRCVFCGRILDTDRDYFNSCRWCE